MSKVSYAMQYVLAGYLFYTCMHVQSCRLLVTPRTIAYPAPLSMEFPRQEYWNGLPFPSPEDLSDPGIEPMSPALAGGFFAAEPSWNP